MKQRMKAPDPESEMEPGKHYNENSKELLDLITERLERKSRQYSVKDTISAQLNQPSNFIIKLNTFVQKKMDYDLSLNDVQGKNTKGGGN